MLRLLFLLLVCACSPLTSRVPREERRPAPESDGGELQLYDMMTQNGTVASRTFRDSAGRVVRVVYYGAAVSGAGLRGPIAERDLVVRAWEVYAYDAAGRRMKDEHVDLPANIFGYTIFGSDGRPLTRRMLVGGVLALESRLDSTGRNATELHFDRTGRYVIGIRGDPPTDIDLPHGWGDAVDGVACGIALTAERGALDSLSVSINLRTSRPISALDLGELPDARMTLIDARGAMIPETTPAAGPPRSLYALLRGSIGFFYPPSPLGDRFRGIAPGSYRLRVEQPIKGGVTVRCNEVPVLVTR